MTSAAKLADPQQMTSAEFAAYMRAKCAQPVTQIQQLRSLDDRIDRFFDHDFEELDDHPVAPAFGTAEEAVEALRIVEGLRRRADYLAVQTMDDIANSHVVDQHGHASVRNMYDAVAKQSGRDLYALEQVRKMFRRCDDIKQAARDGDLSWEHLRLLARVYANRRVRAEFVDQQGWFLLRAERHDFKRFERNVHRWEEQHDQNGAEPNHHDRRTATATQDYFSKMWQRHSTQGPMVGAAMAEIEQAYQQAEFEKDWEAAKAIHGDKTCKDLLARTDAQRRADAQAQIYADAAANPNKSVAFNFVHLIVWTQEAYTEVLRRYAGATPTPLDPDIARCETINGQPLDMNEAFADSLTSALRRVVVDAKGVTLDISHKRFFTGLARTGLMINHDECEWIGCHVPASHCQADHTIPKASGGPTTQNNGTLFCKRHNRHKERGYTVWRDPTTGHIRIKTPTGTEITQL